MELAHGLKDRQDGARILSPAVVAGPLPVDAPLAVGLLPAADGLHRHVHRLGDQLLLAARHRRPFVRRGTARRALQSGKPHASRESAGYNRLRAGCAEGRTLPETPGGLWPTCATCAIILARLPRKKAPEPKFQGPNRPITSHRKAYWARSPYSSTSGVITSSPITAVRPRQLQEN